MNNTLVKKMMLRETMLAKVENVLQGGQADDPPAYTLVLGAGASFGVVPTAKEMLGFQDAKTKSVNLKSIPVWLAHKRNGRATLQTDEERFECVQTFWKKFMADNSSHDKCRNLKIDADGMPTVTSISDAYQSVFETACIGGLDTPEKHRNYMRAVTIAAASSGTQLNATHFYLASLLSLQRRPDDLGSDKRPLYTGRREFARTIFTTNFDPLLQTSLQLFQLLYYMTDRPEILSADALQTDENPAIHLFYAHGSIHRPYMANTDDQIADLKRENARNLAAYLGTHGVIVLGYSGWDDSLLEALNQTKTFSNNLYWLARGADSITEEVSNFLSTHPNAYWVPIDDGDNFMAELHSRLCPGAPNTVMLYNPISALLSQLTSVKLGGIQVGRRKKEQDSDKISPSGAPSDAKTPSSGAPSDVETIRLQVVARLEDAQKLFTETSLTGGDWDELERQADLSYVNNDWDAALTGYDRLLKEQNLPVERKALSLFRHGYASAEKGDIKRAVADYSAVIDLPGAPAKDVALALLNRGVTYGERGERDKAIADYTAVIDLPGAPARNIATARFNRGVTYGEQGEKAKEMADYSAVIDLPGASAEDVALARHNRGFEYGEQGEKDKAIEDYSAIIDLAGAPAQNIATARFNRGHNYGEKGEIDSAIADYSAVIDLFGAFTEDVARARLNRGVIYQKQGETDKAITDYTAVVELPNANVDELAKARFNRGFCYGKKGETGKAVADYSAVIDMPNAPVDIVERAGKALAAINLSEVKAKGDEKKD